MARKSRKNAAAEPIQMPAAGRIYKAGLYARISVETERKREADTIGNQLQLLRDYVSEHSDLSVFDIYSDDDISGTDFIRPEFSRMMNDLRDGKIDCIKDERYTGKMISNKRETMGISTGKMRALPQSEWIIVEDTHEAIISQNMFSEAAASRRSRIKTVNQNTAGERADNLFVCGYCGRKLQKSKGKVTHLFCLKAGVSSNADCTRLHEPIETLQSSVLEVVKMLAKTLTEKAVQVKVNANREEPLLEKKAAMLKRTLQRAQNSKLDLYEEYRNGRMTRDKFIAAQEERQTAIDSMRDELAATEAMITKLRAGKEKAAVLEADAKGIQLLNEYRPKELRKLVEKVRVYENGRIEIDFRCHDDFTEKIIKAVAQLAG